MGDNNNLTNGERLVCLETKVDAIINTQNATNADLKALVKVVNELLPTYITRAELKTHSDEDEALIANLRKANKLQIWLTGIMGTGFGAIMMYLLTFYLENKK